MKWYLADVQDDLEEFLCRGENLKNVKDVEIVFDDGIPTGVLVELTDGVLLHFCSRDVNPDGTRERLNVSTTKEIE